MVTSDDGLPFTVDSYQWNTAECFTNNRHDTPTCFPAGQTTQSVTGNNLLAEDAGTITCTVTIGGVDYTSGPLTLRISGMFLCIQLLQVAISNLTFRIVCCPPGFKVYDFSAVLKLSIKTHSVVSCSQIQPMQTCYDNCVCIYH